MLKFKKFLQVSKVYIFYTYFMDEEIETQRS